MKSEWDDNPYIPAGTVYGKHALTQNVYSKGYEAAVTNVERYSSDVLGGQIVLAATQGNLDDSLARQDSAWSSFWQKVFVGSGGVVLVGLIWLALFLNASRAQASFEVRTEAS